jgi:hypothetical protein
MGRAGKQFADAMDWSTAARLHMDAYSKLLND